MLNISCPVHIAVTANCGMHFTGSCVVPENIHTHLKKLGSLEIPTGKTVLKAPLKKKNNNNNNHSSSTVLHCGIGPDMNCCLYVHFPWLYSVPVARDANLHVILLLFDTVLLYDSFVTAN